MTFSRREFLQYVGISAASASLFGIALPNLKPTHATPQIVQGRALVPTELYDLTGTVTQRVWADSIVNIREHDATWYATDNGFVPREHIQPVNPYTLPTKTPNRLPFYAEVATPVTAVRAYADANAPLVTRIGHGGVMQISDRLENAWGHWYKLTNTEGEPLGWAQVVHWQALPERGNNRHRQHIKIDTAQRRLIAYEGNEAVFHSQVALPRTAQRGQYTLVSHECGCGIHHLTETTYHGVPYLMQLDELPLHGAYWHNQFGAVHDRGTVHLNTLAAKWLYYWATDETVVRIL